MKDVNKRPGLDRPARYQIKVQGKLTENWSDWFSGMTITLENDITLVSNGPLRMESCICSRPVQSPLISRCQKTCSQHPESPSACAARFPGLRIKKRARVNWWENRSRQVQRTGVVTGALHRPEDEEVK